MGYVLTFLAGGMAGIFLTCLVQAKKKENSMEIRAGP